MSKNRGRKSPNVKTKNIQVVEFHVLAYTTLGYITRESTIKILAIGKVSGR